MIKQNPKNEKICPWCRVIFYGDTCPDCGWGPDLNKCPTCGAYFKGDTCPDCGWGPDWSTCPTCGAYFKGDTCPKCLAEQREVELRKRRKMLNNFKSIKYCEQHDNYYLGDNCPKCVVNALEQKEKEDKVNYIKSIQLCEKCGSFFVGDHCNYCTEDSEKRPLLPLEFSKICTQCGTLYNGDFCPSCGEKDQEVETLEESIEKIVDKKLESIKLEQQNTKNTNKNNFLVFTFVASCFFGIVLFMLFFLLPVMKMNLLGNEITTSYNTYALINSFNDYNELSEKVKSLVSCCYAVIIIDFISIFISIYSITKSITSKKIDTPAIMAFLFFCLYIIAFIMMIDIVQIDQTVDYKVKVGAFPIVLFLMSVILFTLSLIEFQKSSD